MAVGSLKAENSVFRLQLGIFIIPSMPIRRSTWCSYPRKLPCPTRKTALKSDRKKNGLTYQGVLGKNMHEFCL